MGPGPNDEDNTVGAGLKPDLIKIFGGFMGKLSILKEFWDFLKVRKKWWLTPIVLVLLLLGTLIVFTQGSALSPFIYTLF